MMANKLSLSCSSCDDQTQTQTQTEIQTPKARFWDGMDIHCWEGFWLEPGLILPAHTFRSKFQPRRLHDDILLASTMKTGTTWLKSLALSIFHRGRAPDLLATDNPHFHVPTIESAAYSTKPLHTDFYDSSSPRLLHTHLPYSLLPDSLKYSPTKIVYIARNPKDTLVSMWHFFNSIIRPFPIQKAVDCFCSGIHQYGPYFDHVAEYWTASRERPEKILFLKYEEMRLDPKKEVAKMAEFMGKAFGSEEEVAEVVWQCSLERLKDLQVNKSESVLVNVPNKCFFRKGEVGDWNNYLTPEMEEAIDAISRRKLDPIGLFL